MKEEKTTKRLHVPEIPIELHTRMKIACATERINVKEWVIEAIAEKLERDKP